MNPPAGNPFGIMTHVDRDARFSIEIPPRWLTDTSGQSHTRVILYDPQTNFSFRPNINVVVESTGALNFDEYLKFNRLQLKRLTGKTQLDVDEPATELQGGWLFAWPLVLPQGLVFARQVVLVRNGKAIIATAMALQTDFESLRVILEAALASLRAIDAVGA